MKDGDAIQLIRQLEHRLKMHSRRKLGVELNYTFLIGFSQLISFVGRSSALASGREQRYDEHNCVLSSIHTPVLLPSDGHRFMFRIIVSLCAPQLGWF